jgi:hypothetical protein
VLDKRLHAYTLLRTLSAIRLNEPIASSCLNESMLQKLAPLIFLGDTFQHVSSVLASEDEKTLVGILSGRLSPSESGLSTS